MLDADVWPPVCQPANWTMHWALIPHYCLCYTRHMSQLRTFEPGGGGRSEACSSHEKCSACWAGTTCVT